MGISTGKIVRAIEVFVIWSLVITGVDCKEINVKNLSESFNFLSF